MKSILVVWNTDRLAAWEIDKILEETNLGNIGEIKYVDKSDFLQYIQLYGFLMKTKSN